MFARALIAFLVLPGVVAFAVPLSWLRAADARLAHPLGGVPLVIGVVGLLWDFGDEQYAVVWRDNAAIHLVHGDRSPTGVYLFQWVRDVDAYYREVVDRGAAVTQAPADRPYGMREFAMRDPNGVDLVFGQDLDSA